MTDDGDAERDTTTRHLREGFVGIAVNILRQGRAPAWLMEALAEFLERAAAAGKGRVSLPGASPRDALPFFALTQARLERVAMLRKMFDLVVAGASRAAAARKVSAGKASVKALQNEFAQRYPRQMVDDARDQLERARSPNRSSTKRRI